MDDVKVIHLRVPYRPYRRQLQIVTYFVFLQVIIHTLVPIDPKSAHTSSDRHIYASFICSVLWSFFGHILF